MLKRLELLWRRLWIRLLTGLMRRPASGRPDWASGSHRLLFLRHDRVGDMILSTAVMKAIAESYPGISLDVLASPSNAPVLEGAPYVRQVIVFDRRNARQFLSAARRLRAERYDGVVDCMVTSPSVTTLLLMLATNAPYRIGIAGRGNEAAINVAVPPAGGEQLMANELGALARAFGIEPESRDWRPTLEVTPADRDIAAGRWRAAGSATGQRVLVNVSAGAAIRQWQVEKFARAIAHLRERMPECVVMITGAPNEWSRVESVAAASGGSAVRTPRLSDVFALVATADFVLTPETSIVHVASAFDRPTVALYRRTESRRWGLHPGVGENVEHDDDTLLTMPVDPVLAAIDRVIQERR